MTTSHAVPEPTTPGARVDGTAAGDTARGAARSFAAETVPAVGAISWQRRVLDVAVALVGLAVLAPVLVAVAFTVRVSSPGPVIFRQVRLTRGRKPFTLYKFRTMRVGTDGPEVTGRGDPRVTAPGRLLRKTSLDELPQLVNVLAGQMTLVGPRPETPALAERYPTDVAWVLDETPGLTGPAQISLRDDVSVVAVPEGPVSSGTPDPEALERWYVEQLVPLRVAVDQTFLRRPTLWATLRVVAWTARYIVTGRPPVIRLDG